MNYSDILNELNKASLFDLFRLNIAINHQLDDPHRIKQVKQSLKVGEMITWFDSDKNRLVEAQLLEIRKTKALVLNQDDGRRWTIHICSINHDNVEADIQTPTGVDRTSLKIGDNVCFRGKSEEELFGKVIKLNPKTAGVMVGTTQWRVAYSLLTLTIDGELGSEPALLEGEFLKLNSHHMDES